MLTMIGLRLSCARSTACQIVSDATAEPPGLSIRNRIAFTSVSPAALSKARDIVSAPMRPGAVDQRDGGALLMRATRSVEVVEGAHELRGFSGARLGGALRLVAVADVIDDVGLQRLVGKQQAAVD